MGAGTGLGANLVSRLTQAEHGCLWFVQEASVGRVGVRAVTHPTQKQESSQII